MKWLFRIIALILALFIGLCVLGFFLPSVQRLDTTVSLRVDAEDIYPLISDLQSYPDWSGVGGPDSEWVFGGAEDGAGQTAAWRAGERVGSLEILQAASGEFVIIRAIGPLGEQTITLALDEDPVETAFLLQAERNLGGFPYLGRIAALRQKARTQAALDQAAQGLVALFR